MGLDALARLAQIQVPRQVLPEGRSARLLHMQEDDNVVAVDVEDQVAVEDIVREVLVMVL